MSCDLAQGFHLAGPLDAGGVAALLSRQAARAPGEGDDRPWIAITARPLAAGTESLPQSA
jgi:hypothetical protein